MIGVIQTTKINIRSGMTTATGTDMGDLFAGDVVIGTVIDGWIAFDRVYRKTVGVAVAEPLGFTRYAAVHEPSNPGTKHIMLVDANITPAPVPTTPSAQPLNIAIGGDAYETVNVELKPKA